MISRGDDSARNAFRAALREDTPLPVQTVHVNATQELDPRDILEVQELADAIARAEQSTPVLSKSRPKDLFDRLAKPTDDASGPALPALPVIPMPPSTQPLLDTTEDAYYAPGGRVRTLADVTLDGYRVESTLQVRIKNRRSTATWIVAALLLPLSVLAIGGALYARSGDTPVAVTTTSHATITKAEPAPEKKTAAPKAEPPKSDVPVFDVNTLPTAKAK